MPYSIKVEDAVCRYCGDDDIYMDVKEEPSLYKVGAYCHSCDRDYGVLDHVSRNDVDHMDEVWAEAETYVQRYLEQL